MNSYCLNVCSFALCGLIGWGLDVFSSISKRLGFGDLKQMRLGVPGRSFNREKWQQRVSFWSQSTPSEGVLHDQKDAHVPNERLVFVPNRCKGLCPPRRVYKRASLNRSQYLVLWESTSYVPDIRVLSLHGRGFRLSVITHR